MVEVTQNIGRFEALALIAILIVAGLALAAHLVRTSDCRKVATAMVAAVIVDVAIRLTTYTINPRLLADELFWHTLASAAARYFRGESAMATSSVEGKDGYVWVLGALYAAGGATPLLAIVLNIMAHVLLVGVAARSTRILVDQSDLSAPVASRTVAAAAYLTAILPSFTWWTPNVLRETITLLLIASAVMLATKSLASGRAYPMVLAAGCLALLTWIRGTLGISVTLALMAALMFVWFGRSRYHALLRFVSLVLLVLIGMPIVVAITAFLDISADNIAIRTAELSETASSGFTGLGSSLDVGSIVRIIAPRVAFGPFPWELTTSGVMLLAAVELACWLLVLFFAWRGIRLTKPRGILHGSRWLIPIYIVVAFAILFGLMFTVGNYGILARFRPIPTIVLVPLAGLGFAWPFRTREGGGSSREPGFSSHRSN